MHELAYRIRPAEVAEAKTLQSLETNAAARFAEIGMDDLAQASAAPLHHYRSYISGTRAFVAAQKRRIAGYALIDHLDGHIFIADLCVDIRDAGQRLGAQLLGHISTVFEGRAMSLSCFADVPWNAPYYARLGFRRVQANLLGPAHVEIAKDERKRFAPWPRCIMERNGASGAN